MLTCCYDASTPTQIAQTNSVVSRSLASDSTAYCWAVGTHLQRHGDVAAGPRAQHVQQQPYQVQCAVLKDGVARRDKQQIQQGSGNSQFYGCGSATASALVFIHNRVGLHGSSTESAAQGHSLVVHARGMPEAANGCLPIPVEQQGMHDLTHKGCC